MVSTGGSNWQIAFNHRLTRNNKYLHKTSAIHHHIVTYIHTSKVLQCLRGWKCYNVFFILEPLHPAVVGEVTTATIATIPKKHNSKHLSAHQYQWIRFAIHASQQLTSPIVSYL